jgi:hypothetical protein
VTGHVQRSYSPGMPARREPNWAAVDEALGKGPGGRTRTLTCLRDYFAPVDDWRGKSGFTGSVFETFAGGGDKPDVKNRFTAADLVAVALLGVNVPGRAAVVLLEDADEAFQAHLTAIPTDVALEDVEHPLETDMPRCDELYRSVKALTGLGQTKTSKLLARKRPHLLPVIDDVTWRALGRPSVIWEPLRRRLREGGLASELRDLGMEAAVPAHVSNLRILDVALWMRHR